MIRITSILLLSVLCFQFLFKAGVAGYYFANKDYIARVLCINKENKTMHCDGKCYLKQKMQAADGNTKQATASIKYEPVEFLTAPVISVSGVPFMITSPSHVTHAIHYASVYGNAVFQPPC
ncbi:MAG: hypothetical protein V4658_05175 [Bacteroidota bacterium]